jgi:hypothetical protein
LRSVLCTCEEKVSKRERKNLETRAGPTTTTTTAT